MSSFVRFVMKFKKSECPFGDLARDMKEDANIRRTWGFRTTKKYLESRGACDRAMDALQSCNEAYIIQQQNLYTT